MLQRIMLFLLSAALFAFFVSMIFLMWYVALPVMLILFGIAWWRATQIRKMWEKVFIGMHAAAGHSRHSEEGGLPSDVIDADYTEL